MLNWFGRRLQEVQDKKASGEAGFTLIELLVVVIIIGILAAIAIPVFLSQRSNAEDAAAKANLGNYATAQASYAAANDNFATAEGALADYGYQTSATPNVTATSDADSFCAQAAGGTGTFKVTDTATNPQSGSC